MSVERSSRSVGRSSISGGPAGVLGDLADDVGPAGRGRSWPMSGYMTSLAPGTARAVAIPPVGVTSGSARPWTTSVGARTRPRSHVRSLLAAMATVWRAAPSGRQLRSKASCPICRAASASKCDPAVRRKISTPLSTASASRAGDEPWQLAQQRPLDPAVLAVAGVGHDRRQAVHAGPGGGWPWPGRSSRPSRRPRRAPARCRGGRAGRRRRRPCRRRCRAPWRSAAGSSTAGSGGWSAAGRRSATTGRCRGCRSGSRGTPAPSAARRSRAATRRAARRGPSPAAAARPRRARRTPG